MPDFNFEKPDAKTGAIREYTYSDKVRDIVCYIPSSEGVCCTDCGKEFTETMGFSTRPFEGKLQCLLSHYKQTDCQNSRD